MILDIMNEDKREVRRFFGAKYLLHRRALKPNLAGYSQRTEDEKNSRKEKRRRQRLLSVLFISHNSD